MFHPSYGAVIIPLGGGEEFVVVTILGVVEEEVRPRAGTSGIELCSNRAELEEIKVGMNLEGFFRFRLLDGVKGFW